MYAFNNISYATGGNSYDYGGLHASSANDLSDDAFSPDASHRNKTLTFANVSTGTEDFHLVAADTDAIGLGSDRSSRFTVDITGATRTTWDIGPFLYVEAGTEVLFALSPINTPGTGDVTMRVRARYL
jgi:hypothetical protein